jgi:hypothetical protein
MYDFLHFTLLINGLSLLNLLQKKRLPPRDSLFANS